MKLNALKKGQYIYLTTGAINYLHIKKAVTGESLSTLIEDLIQQDMELKTEINEMARNVFAQETEQA